MPKSGLYPEYKMRTASEKPKETKKMEPQGKQKVDMTPSKHRNGESPIRKELPVSRSLVVN